MSDNKKPVLLTESQAASWLDVHPSTLQKWRLRGLIDSMNLGKRCVRYMPEILEKFTMRAVRPATAERSA